MDVRHEMICYSNSNEFPTQHISLYLPDIGNVTITYESNPIHAETAPRLVLNFDFPLVNEDNGQSVRIIDMYGDDRDIER